MKNEIPKQKDNLTTRLAGYAATAGAMMALAPNVNGQVVHSGVQNIQLFMPSDSVEIDLDGNAAIDFSFRINGSSSYGSYSGYFYQYGFGYGVIINPKTDTYKNSWITRMTSIQSTSYTNSQTYYSTFQTQIVNGLDAGVMVDASQSMWSNLTYPSYAGAMGIGWLYLFSGAYYQGSYAYGYGDFFEETKFIGVRFYIGANQHYGWIRVRLGEYIDPVTIIDWAYESTPGLGILTGDGGDLTAPVATLDAGLTTTEEQTVQVQINFNENISGLTAEDFVITNGTANNLSEFTPGKIYTIEVTANTPGTVTIELPEGSVIDASGNGNGMASVSWDYIVDQTPPVTTLDAGISETDEQTIIVTISFDKEISGLGINDFEVSNGSAANLTVVTPRTEFTIEVTAASAGTVQVTLPAGSVKTDGGGENTEAVVSWEYTLANAISNSNELPYKLFPNPADNLIHIELESMADVTVIHNSGKVVLQKNDVLNESLDVSQLAPGIYILQIKGNKQTIRDKIVIN
jgi:hypothetical protein